MLLFYFILFYFLLIISKIYHFRLSQQSSFQFAFILFGAPNTLETP